MRFGIAIRGASCAALAALALAPTAAAHVAIDPTEGAAGSFSRFNLDFLNESQTATTTKIVVKWPETVPDAKFLDVPGWTRTVKTVELANPVTDDDGNQITERIDTVTWEGGAVKPGEFGEFGMTFALPEDPGTLSFPTVQTYSDGTVVRWIGPADSEEPAAQLTVVSEGDGTEPSSSGDTGTTAGGSTESAGEEPAATATSSAEAASAASDDDSEGRATLALVVAILALVAGLGALGWVLFRPGKS